MGDSPAGLAGAEWAETVGAQTLGAVQSGFAADAERADDWPPSSSVFAALCRGDAKRNRADNVVRTYVSGSYYVPRERRIESEHSRAVADRNLAEICKKLGIKTSAAP